MFLLSYCILSLYHVDMNFEYQEVPTKKTPQEGLNKPTDSPELIKQNTNRVRMETKQRLVGLQGRVRELQEEVMGYAPVDTDIPAEDRALSEAFMASRKRQLETVALQLRECYGEAERLNLVEQRPLQSESVPRVSEKILNTPIRDIFERFQIKGAEAPLQDNKLFSSIVVLQEKKPPTEPLVRVYRGVQKANEGLVRFIPYAMRTEDGHGGATVVEGVREQVDRLAKEPTYQNFLEYVRVASPHWNEKERARMAKEIRSLEDGVLNGRSVKDELFLNQIQHGGGATMDSGLSPYVAITTDPKEALGYAGETGNLIVMDVPLSQLGAYQSTGELNLLGSADDKYVTAILPRSADSRDLSDEDRQKSLEQALSLLDSVAPVASDKGSEWHDRFRESSQQTQEDGQRSQDVKLIREKRASDIARTFRSAKLNLDTLRADAERKGTDIYTESMGRVFDHYLDRFSKLGGTRRPRDIQEYDYGTNDGHAHAYDRSHVNEEMLVALRKLVQNLEERYG